MNSYSKTIPLSVCLITKNEESMLQKCIDSVVQVASEIIIVDTGSSDNTITIAKNNGCIVHQIAWENDFSKARNFALSFARNPFVLSIDADERLINPDELYNTLENAKPTTGGWLVNVTSEARRLDGSIDTYISSLLRLFRNHPQFRFTGIIHEQIIESIINAGYKIENTHINFIHYGYSHSPDSMKIKQLRNLELLNQALKNEPEKSYDLYQRAKTHLALGDLDNAESDIVKALEFVNPDSAVKPQALNFGGIIAYQRRDYEKAIIRATESLNIVPNQAFAHFILGESYSALNRFAEAHSSYLEMNAAYKNKDFLASIVGDYYLPPEHLAFRLGRSLIGMKLYNEALLEFEKGLKINPNDIGCIVGAANVAFLFKKYNESKQLLEKALRIEPDRDEIKAFLVQVEDALKQNINAKPTSNSQPSVYSSQPLLSLCMIVKNEEEMLPGCLESAQNLVDEIIITDTGSTDGTKRIAEKYNAKIYDFIWNDDFASARNEALKHCSGKWILYLDADERIVNSSVINLRNILSGLNSEIGGLICTIESDHLQLDGNTEKHRGGYPRIFRNYGYPNIQFQGRVHEQITPSIFALGKSIEFSDVIIEHLGYNKSRTVMEEKVRRNYRMLIQHVQEEPLNGYAWYQLGQTLAQMQLFDEAENAIRFALQTGKLSDSVYASATATLSQLTGNKRNFEESLKWAEQSLEKAPRQIYALHLKAYSLMYLNRFDESEISFLEVKRRIKEKKGVPYSGFDIDIPEHIVERGIEELYIRRQQKGMN